MGVSGVYFDGETARDYQVNVSRSGPRLEFTGEGISPQSWSIAGLHPIDPPSPGQPFRITHDNKIGARLILRDEAFIQDLVAANPHLKGGYSWRHVGQIFGWTAGGLAALAATGYLFMTVLPQQVAGLLPQSFRNDMGTQVVRQVVGSAKLCDKTDARAGVSAMVAALSEGGIELPPVAIEIYDMGLVNAFAAPGGRIILTRGLINEASTPDEVIGVLAHEYGHVYHLHPEAQLVRIFGMQILASAISGGTSGDLITSAAGLAALLRYTRDAEREADLFARDVMTKASVDPIGLKNFFEKLLKLEGGKPKDANSETTALDRIGNVFSTHPGTEDRIKEIQPLPAGQTPKKVMTEEQWQALRKACE
jgi:beta-barrel assembly-enhancing protease